MRVSVNIRHALMIAGLILSLSACVSSTSSTNYSDYRAGQEYAEVMAKEDASNDICIFTRHRYRLEMTNNLNGHIASMEGKRADSFIKGFRFGYKQYFKEYMDLYCGD